MVAESIKRVSIPAFNIWMWILSVECYAWIKTGLSRQDHHLNIFEDEKEEIIYEINKED